MSEVITETVNQLDAELFRAEAISEETRRFNEEIVKILTPMPNWFDVGAQIVRDARARGDGPFPLAPKSARARTIRIEGKAARFRCESSPLRIPKVFIFTSTAEAWCSDRRISRIPCSSVSTIMRASRA